MIAWAEHARARLAALDTSDELLEELDRERQRLAAQVGELAGRLTAARSEAAGRFSDAVSVELAGLAMPHARVEVAVPPRSAGRDEPTVTVGGAESRSGRTAPTRSSCGCWPTRARRRCRCRRAPPAVSCPG